MVIDDHPTRPNSMTMEKWMKNEGSKEEDLSTAQKNIENAAKKIRHRTKAQREKERTSTPENVRLCEEAAARCTAKIKQIILRKQARKARAEHLVKCSLEPGKKKAKRKPLTNCTLKGTVPKTEQNGKKNFQGTVKRCTPTWKKQKEPKKKELNIFKNGTNNSWRTDATQRSPSTWFCKPEEGQRARRRYCERDDQEAAHGEDLHYYEVFSGTFHGYDRVSKLMVRKLDAAPTEGIRSCSER